MPIEQVYIFAWIMAIIGFVIGMIVHWIISKPKNTGQDDGVLFVDISDPDNPYLHLGLSKEDLVEICKKKSTATFMVVHTDKPIS